MKDWGYRVSLVLHEEYGEKLIGLVNQRPVWVVNTPINNPVVRKLWTIHSNRSHLVLGERFADDTPIKLCMRGLSSIDLNGRLKTRASCSEIEIIGAALTDELRHAFGEYGFNRFEESPDGFVAYREKV